MRSRGSGAHLHEGAFAPQGGPLSTPPLASDFEGFGGAGVAPVNERESGKAVAAAFTQERERIRGILQTQLSRSKEPEAVEVLTAADIIQEGTSTPSSSTAPDSFGGPSGIIAAAPSSRAPNPQG
jgi:hypothetical protein